MSYAEQEKFQQSLQMASSPGRNVLIVDDNATNRNLLRDFLQAEGYGTAEAEDGIEALIVLEREHVDIVVCDVLMPNLDGYGLCSEVRRRQELKHLFFVLYTATDFTPNDEKFALELGADRFITKQGSPSVILKTIEETIGERKEGRSEQPKRTNGLLTEREMKKYSTLMIRQLEQNSIELKQARNELRNLNEKLEKRVGDRTAQLEIANRELEVFNNLLEQRVASRTSELATKNAILESRTEELRRSNGDLEQFASVASHDLQEPLRAMAGCIQVFQRKYGGKFGKESDDLIRMIVDGSARMKALIDGLLADSRAGKHEKLETIDTALVLQQVLADLRVAINESKAKINFGKLPSLRFVKGQFGQVLQNLVGNAIKYRSAIPPKISIHAERQTAAWIFSIADNGIGFEQQYSEKIFDVFQRLHTRDQYVGTGIGLAIGKKIVERRGGKIWVESVPHQGSTFFFSIPDKAAALESLSI